MQFRPPLPATYSSYTTASALYQQQQLQQQLQTQQQPQPLGSAGYPSPLSPSPISDSDRSDSPTGTTSSHAVPVSAFAFGHTELPPHPALLATSSSSTTTTTATTTADERTITIGQMQFSSPSATGGTFPLPLPTLLPMRNSPRSSPRPSTTSSSSISSLSSSLLSSTHHQQTPPSGTRFNSNHIAPSMHPSFMNKAVCILRCRYCDKSLSRRGMRAILLADTRVELYSTDAVPKGVQLVAEDYRTQNCRCRIRDVACLSCGCSIGYHVTQPCRGCLEASNNGHLWMFHSDSVKVHERMDSSGTRMLKWGELGDVQDEEEEWSPWGANGFVCR